MLDCKEVAYCTIDRSDFGDCVIFGVNDVLRRLNSMGATPNMFIDDCIKYLRKEYLCEGDIEIDIEKVRKQLDELNYLPIKIKSLVEGTVVPTSDKSESVPILSVENTDAKYAWLVEPVARFISQELETSIYYASMFYKYGELAGKYYTDEHVLLSAIWTQNAGARRIDVEQGAVSPTVFNNGLSTASVAYARKYYTAKNVGITSNIIQYTHDDMRIACEKLRNELKEREYVKEIKSISTGKKELYIFIRDKDGGIVYDDIVICKDRVETMVYDDQVGKRVDLEMTVVMNWLKAGNRNYRVIIPIDCYDTIRFLKQLQNIKSLKDMINKWITVYFSVHANSDSAVNSICGVDCYVGELDDAEAEFYEYCYFDQCYYHKKEDGTWSACYPNMTGLGGVAKTLWSISGREFDSDGKRWITWPVAILCDCVTLDKAEQIYSRLDKLGYNMGFVTMGLNNGSLQCNNMNAVHIKSSITYLCKGEHFLIGGRGGLAVVTSDDHGRLVANYGYTTDDYPYVKSNDKLRILYNNGVVV